MTKNNSVLLSTPNIALEKHLSFWDRKNKGYITPVDTVLGFVNLGYGVIFSITIGTVLSVLFSIFSQDTLLLDPRFRTNVKDFQNNIKNAPYDEFGNFDPDLFDELFSKYSKSDIGGKSITLKEILEWNDLSYKTPITSSKIALEWLTTYLLVGNHWILKREDVQAAYDGSLFYRLREQNKQHNHIHNENKKKQPKYYSNIQVSGFQLPKTYVYQLETQLNSIIHLLPKSAVTKVETQLNQLFHLLKENNNQPLNVLNGVSTNSLLSSKNIFNSLSNGLLSSSNDQENMNEEIKNETSETYYNGGSLTGVLTLNLLDHQSVQLTGVKGYKQSDEEINDQMNEANFMDDHHHHLTGIKSSENEDQVNENESIFGYQVVQEQQNNHVSLTGIVPEGEDYYRDTPRTNWLHINKLTGVPSYHNEQIELEEDEDEDEDEDINNEADDEQEVDDQKINHFISPISSGILLPLSNNNDDKENKIDDDNEKYEKNNDNSKSIQKQPSNSHLPSSSSISSSSSSQEDEDFDHTPISPTIQDHQEALKKIETNNEWPSLAEVTHN